LEKTNVLRLLCHVGVPKSATTSLQLGAFPIHPDIRYGGKPYYDATFGYEGSLATAQLIDSFWKQDELDFDYEVAHRRFEKGMLPRLSSDKLMVISEEGLSQARFTDRSLVAKRMASIFEGLDVKILITIREQKSALFSLYQWYHTRLMITDGLDEWLRNCHTYSTYRGSPIDFPLREYQFSRLLKLYTYYFGENNVLVLPMEMLFRTPQLFYGRLEEFAGIRKFWGKQECPEFPRENQSPGRLGIQYQRFFKRLEFAWNIRRGKEPVLSEALLTDPIHHKFMKWIAHIDHPLKPMSRASAAWLDDFYREDNRNLERLTGLDLTSLGYTL
jgi:hypothetical protein